MRLGELAERLQLEVDGDPDFEVTGLAGLEDAGPSDLSFLSEASYLKSLAASHAGAVLAPRGLEVGRPCIRSLAPYADFGRAVPLFFSAPPAPEGIHATAVIGDRVELGDEVAIGAYCVIGDGARIGARTRLYPHVVLYPGVRIGDDCELHSGAHLRSGVRIGARVVVCNGAVVGSDGFGFATDANGRRVRIPHRCGVDIGDDVEIGANTTIDSAHPGHARLGFPEARTRIANGVKIDNQVQIGHGCSIGEGSALCAQVGLAGSTVLGRGVFMAGQSAAKGHIHIGDGSLIGGATSVTSSVPPGAQILGVPPGLERRRWARIVAAWKRLPDLLVRVRELERRMGPDR